MNKIDIAVQGTNMVEDAVKETPFPTQRVRQIFLDCFEKLLPTEKPLLPLRCDKEVTEFIYTVRDIAIGTGNVGLRDRAESLIKSLE